MPFSDDNKLEPEYADAFASWQKTPGPEQNTAVLKAVDPIIQGAIRTHIGQSNPLLYSRARRLTLDGLRSYDPKRGRLQTHLYNHLQGLKRIHGQHLQVLAVPERQAIARYQLDRLEDSLRNELGRDPTDAELSEHGNIPPARLHKLRQMSGPAVAEGTMEGVSGDVYGGVQTPHERPGMPLWHQVVYDSLDPYHKKVMEHGLGLHGRQTLANHEIAAKLQRSPGAISQAKLRIQKMLDEEQELSPFN